jgi:cobyrinic acid a,c-diamide synthase
MKRLLIAGTHSGCGKTTVTLALLAAFRARGLALASFKCGPDYIDPMFHRRVLGVPSHNLDPFFCEPAMLKRLFAANAGGDLSVIEGVMGYYDGIGPEGAASSYHVAAAVEAPAILVVNARGMSTSAGAVLQGFSRFRENSRIRGVVFNHLPEAMYPMMRKIAEEAGIVPFGFLPPRPDLSIESRHLGLVTAEEIGDLGEKTRSLGTLAEAHLELDGLLELAAAAPAMEAEPLPKRTGTPRVRIAVARDKAFCFLYQENLELLEALGCELVWFSPLADEAPPEHVGGLYLCGGYPELYATALSKNASMLSTVKKLVESGLPTIAECGGFMVLQQALDGIPMAGVLPGTSYKTGRLQRFGYITLEAERDNLLCARGESIRAHEFHYFDSTDCGGGYTAVKASRPARYPCVHATDSLYAGFPHLYFPANPRFAESFVRKAISYAERHHRTDQNGGQSGA